MSIEIDKRTSCAALDAPESSVRRRLTCLLRQSVAHPTTDHDADGSLYSHTKTSPFCTFLLQFQETSLESPPASSGQCKLDSLTPDAGGQNHT